MKQEPLVLERILDASTETVWDALTNNSKMKQWYFNLEAFRPEPGFQFRFYGGKDDRQYLHLCEVMTVEPGKKLSYTWKYQDYPGESLVTFELIAEGDKTRLKLTHEGLETFATDNPDFARESFTKGWEHIVGTSLVKYLQGPVEHPVS